MILDKIPSAIQAACAYIARPTLTRMGIDYKMKDVCQELKVDHLCMLEQARQFERRLSTSPHQDAKKIAELQGQLKESLFLKDIYHYKSEHPDCWVKCERHKLSEDFKILILSKKDEYGLDWSTVSRLLDIPEDTLKKFKRQNNEDRKDGPGGSALRDLPEHIVEKLSEFFKGRSGKATVKGFCDKNPEVLSELKIEYREFSKLLLYMGFTNPKGIFLNNTGLDCIKRFSPNMIWGTDGKNMTIVINGESFSWVWQCLIDYKTTVLVGGVVEAAETTENLFKAMVQAKERTGISPMAIVMDNRLSENLPSIREYLDSMGIEIIKIFPKNSKSNGIIENNFRVFEQWILSRGGKIVINASSPKELSKALAQLLTEIFTQLRNVAPRKKLHGKSALETSATYREPSGEERDLIRAQIKALAHRFKNELASPVMTKAKELALQKAIELLKPPSEEVFRKRLNPSYFTADLILQALGIFQTQRQKHPEKSYDHTYFGGILRNLADQQNLESLQMHLEALYQPFWKKMQDDVLKHSLNSNTLLKKTENMIDECLNAKIPAQGTLVMQSLKSLMAFISGRSLEVALNLRGHLALRVKKAKQVSVKHRERILRKLYEIETYIRSVQLEFSHDFEKISKVLDVTAELQGVT